MTDETKITMEKNRYYRIRTKKVVDNLKDKFVDSHFASESGQALSQVIELLPEKGKIGIGDSMTLHQIGLIEWFKDRNEYQVFNPFLWSKDGSYIYDSHERYELMRKALVSDVFLASANAITLNGEIIIVDGHGNRVAATIFGPSHAILVTGSNKIVKDIPSGLERIKEECAPLNAIRHFEKHKFRELPCAKDGSCVDCQSELRICRKTVIINGQSPGFFIGEEKGLSVILVGESLGI